MDVGGDGMAGAMNEILAVTGFLNVSASGAIDLPSGKVASRADGIDHCIDTCVTRSAYDFKNFAHLARRRCAHEAHPGNVVKNGVRSFLLSPDVKQQQVALANRHRMAGVRLVVRIAGVGVDRHNWRVAGKNVLAIERIQEPLLNFVLLVPPLPTRRPTSFKAFAQKET